MLPDSRRHAGIGLSPFGTASLADARLGDCPDSAMELALVMTLGKHKKHLMRGLTAAAVLAGAALVWFSLHGPERARNSLAVSMEKESATFFAAEQDLTALTQDVQSGAAAG